MYKNKRIFCEGCKKSINFEKYQINIDELKTVSLQLLILMSSSWRDPISSKGIIKVSKRIKAAFFFRFIRSAYAQCFAVRITGRY